MENELNVIARHAQKAPVDLIAMFNDLGVDFSEVRLRRGESGWIERNGDQYRVVINAGESPARRRFTAAHELAHYLLHRDLMDDGGRMNRHVDRLYDDYDEVQDSSISHAHEVQANRLAAQIVMPADLVRREHAEGLDLEALARAFVVSKPAMEIRLKTLGLTA